jgi:hypothetical protein
MDYVQDIKVGMKFKTRGKAPRLCTVQDILTTTNLAGEVVKTEYLCTHEFLGQVVTSRECKVTIQRGYVEE